MAITYDEIRTWARWLNAFTAEELADALGNVPVELGERAVKALLWHGIVEDTGIEVEGREGAVRIYEYVPLPPGPKVHPRHPPPEVVIFWEMGGDPLKQPRGMPVASGVRRGNMSTVGRRRPGRRNMKREDRIMKIGK